MVLYLKKIFAIFFFCNSMYLLCNVFVDASFASLRTQSQYVCHMRSGVYSSCNSPYLYSVCMVNGYCLADCAIIFHSELSFHRTWMTLSPLKQHRQWLLWRHKTGKTVSQHLMKSWTGNCVSVGMSGHKNNTPPPFSVINHYIHTINYIYGTPY